MKEFQKSYFAVYTLFNIPPYDVPISNDAENNVSRKAEEEHIMEMQNVKDQVKNVFTPARLKKAAALAVLIGIVSAGGAYYHHSQAEARSAMEKQARSEMLATQAEQRGIVLIDEDHVRTIAAGAIGKDVTELDFRKVYLTMKDHDDRDGKHDKKHKHDRKYDRDGWREHDRDRHGMMPPPAAPEAAPTDGSGQMPAAEPTPTMTPVQPPVNMGQPEFHPIYKVKCYAGNVEYKLRIDAVTGNVLSSEVDADDDLF